jgi:RND family efflux transporter MFP subunit
VTLTGTVQAQSEINLAFRVDGRVTQRLVSVGNVVRVGQLLATLDPQNEESSLRGARAQLVAARAQQVEAKNSFERMRDLVVEEAVSRASYEQAESALKSAESAVEAAQSQVSLAGNRLAYTRLIADVAGVVTQTERGEVVAAGHDRQWRRTRRAMQSSTFRRRQGRYATQSEIAVSLTMNPRISTAGRIREVARARARSGRFASASAFSIRRLRCSGSKHRRLERGTRGVAALAPSRCDRENHARIGR